MEFSLSEEQEMFRSYVRKYLDDIGQTNVARDFIDGNKETYNQTVQGLAELGCTSINISENYGGMGLGALDLIPVLEELGRALLPGLYVETMAFAAPLIEKYGSEEQKQAYLSNIASGEINISLAWVEPQKGFEPNEVEVSAQVNEDSLLIEGVKTLVPDSDQVDTYLVLVRTGEGNSKEALSLVFIDKEDIEESRILNSIEETRILTELTFNNLKVTKSRLLGNINEGWSILQEGLMHLNAALCSTMVGSMDQIVEMATEYAKIREQFGQPIGRFQAIKHTIVDMKMDLETARSLSYYANWALENATDDRDVAICSARAFITEAYNKAASDNIQIHGGIGFTEEMDCHLYVKRARYYENYLGSVRDYREKAAVALDW